MRALRINDMLILDVLALNNATPSYTSDLFTKRQTSISLRGKRRLVIQVIPLVNTTIMVFIHFDIMPANYRTYCRMMSACLSLAAFKIAVKTVQLDIECCSFCDQC